MNTYLIAFLGFIGLYLFFLKARTCGSNQKICIKKKAFLFSMHLIVLFTILTLVTKLKADTFESDDIRDILAHIDNKTLVIFDKENYGEPECCNARTGD